MLNLSKVRSITFRTHYVYIVILKDTDMPSRQVFVTKGLPPVSNGSPHRTLVNTDQEMGHLDNETPSGSPGPFPGHL